MYWIAADQEPFQLSHTGAHVIRGTFNVKGISSGHVCMAENRLNRFFGYAQTVQVCSKPATGCVPAVPLRKHLVSLKVVVQSSALGFEDCLSAFLLGLSTD